MRDIGNGINYALNALYAPHVALGSLQNGANLINLPNLPSASDLHRRVFQPLRFRGQTESPDDRFLDVTDVVEFVSVRASRTN